ncbi:MAG: hypothetical protein B1H03_05660 [Planctomycetales bacterium 4484_113]|nr:MAG: hypothetical protein B1H03_05660 [Planctomycetales bacterium 4484_113]
MAGFRIYQPNPDDSELAAILCLECQNSVEVKVSELEGMTEFTCPSCGHTESARSEVIRFLTQELRGGAGPPYQ